MPPFTTFDDPVSYYGTGAHELIHWSGKEGRTGRLTTRHGTGIEARAFEELVAELGSTFVCAELGIAPEPREENAAYIQHWKKMLRADPHLFFHVASQAQKAADFLAHRERGQEAQAEQTIEATFATQDRKEGYERTP
jgi:antirestriction protein ArdC